MASFIAVLWRVNESRTKNGIKNIKLGYLKDSNAAAHSVDTGIR